MRGARFGGRWRPPGERSVVVVPARIELHDVGLALAERAGGDGPAAQLDVAGVVELLLVVGEERAQVAGAQRLEGALVPGEVGAGILFGAWKVRHAAACDEYRAH